MTKVQGKCDFSVHHPFKRDGAMTDIASWRVLPNMLF